ncbi:MAG: DNA polymerase III subunit delta' [Thiohalomonadales bacterium]
MKLNNHVSPLYPWQKDIWSRLCNTSINNRIAHALLFTGPKGVGKLQFAKTLKNSLLCSENTPGELACGECRFCKMQHHPDFHEVTFEEDERTGKISNSIKIDQIRKLIDFSLLHTHYGLAKIITIHPAETMTNNAANALLKILEEPPDNTYFVLICNEIHRLSATIKSRCQRIEFNIPDIEDSTQWLQSHDISEDTASSCLIFASNAPLAAKILAETNYIEQHSKFIKSLISIANKSEDPVVIANSWLKIESSLPLHALYSCLSDIILLKTVQNSSEITNKLNRDILQNIANSVGFTGLYVILDKIILAKPQIQSNVAILGIYEDILNLWQRLTNNVIPQVYKG